MKHSRASILLVTLVGVVAAGLLFGYIGHARKSAAQDAEKSLNIERYRNEPFELVDLKIGQNSVKSGIKSKVKNSRSQPVLDDVKFREKDDWSRNVKVRLRNISGRPIYGLTVSLFFEHISSRTGFEIRLKRAQNRDLKNQPLQPGDEIDLEVTDKDFNETMTMIRQYGLNPHELPVILAWTGPRSVTILGGARVVSYDEIPTILGSGMPLTRPNHRRQLRRNLLRHVLKPADCFNRLASILLASNGFRLSRKIFACVRNSTEGISVFLAATMVPVSEYKNGATAWLASRPT